MTYMNYSLRGVKVNYKATLRFAASTGRLEMVKYLVEHGPPGVDARANYNAALGWASSNGHVEIVKYLLEHRKLEV